MLLGKNILRAGAVYGYGKGVGVPGKKQGLSEKWISPVHTDTGNRCYVCVMTIRWVPEFVTGSGEVTHWRLHEKCLQMPRFIGCQPIRPRPPAPQARPDAGSLDELLTTQLVSTCERLTEHHKACQIEPESLERPARRRWHADSASDCAPPGRLVCEPQAQESMPGYLHIGLSLGACAREPCAA